MLLQGGEMGLGGRAQIAGCAVWVRCSVLFCFPLLGCGRIPSKPQPLWAEPELQTHLFTF